MTVERRWFAALVAISAAGVFVRLIHLNAIPGLNPDEVEVVLQWFRHPVVPWYVAPSGRPHLNPLGPVLLWPFATFAQPAPWVVRMPAVLAGLSVLPAVYWMARRTSGRATAVSATMLAASAPILIAYSRLGWDPAFVPVVATLALGFAFARRLVLAGVATMQLVLVHPTAAFVFVMAAAPFVFDLWRAAALSPQRRLRRVILVAVAAIGYVLLVGAIAGQTGGIPFSRAPAIAGLVLARLGSATGLADFVGGYRETVGGGAIYAGFVGGPVSASTLWSLAVTAAIAVSGGALLWKQRRRNEAILVAGLAASLLAQYLSQGAGVASVFRERYLLWSAVPSCLAAVFIVQAICASYRLNDWSPAVVAGLAGIWLATFYVGYIRPFERNGGESAVLDYRTSAIDPRVAALAAIRTHRQHPGAPASVFVGESRLELALLYLASADPTLEIRNLGGVRYSYYQRDDRPELLRLHESGVARDVFFVDYEWDRLPGGVRNIPTFATASVAEAVAPWTATVVEALPTADGRPLLRIWRLSKPASGSAD